MQARLITTNDGIYWAYDRKFLDEEEQTLLEKLQSTISKFKKCPFTLIIDLCGIRILLREDRELIMKVSVYCQTNGMNKQIYVVDTWKVSKMKIQAKLYDMPYHENFYAKSQEMEDIKDDLFILN